MDTLIQAWVWEARAGEGEAFRSVLSEEEARRADRFFSAIDRERWVVARGRTRQLLAEVVGVDARSIVFGIEAGGRPFVVGDTPAALSFNLSRSENVGALAISHHVQVGIDIEAVRPINDEEIAWALSPAERKQLDAVDSDKRLETFFRFWTLKEAYMKGTGLGASLPLHDFDVGLDGPKLLRVARSLDEPARWSFAEAVPFARMRAAITARTDGRDMAVNWRRCD